ncbi:hypothetical protein K438DRAFT_553663 [Mycena galopus ATCC 62051]|nr:hypothetical protein K438DRAFT_553663 [Mycena galopus ATCC 62051]
MERGFALSPMADLVRAYNSSSDSKVSLFRRVTMLASKASFDVSDILDRGISLDSSEQVLGIAQFSLEAGFLFRTERTLRDMQETLSQAASMVEGRNSCFCIDPHRILVTVFRNANSLGELQASWSALAECLNLANKNFRSIKLNFKPYRRTNSCYLPYRRCRSCTRSFGGKRRQLLMWITSTRRSHITRSRGLKGTHHIRTLSEEPPVRLSVRPSVRLAPAHRTAPLPRPILHPTPLPRPASPARPAFGPEPQAAPSPGTSSPVPPDSVPLRSLRLVAHTGTCYAIKLGTTANHFGHVLLASTYKNLA